jgi:sugar lactone lactonase YvrE
MTNSQLDRNKGVKKTTALTAAILLLIAVQLATAQSFSISTLAGNGHIAFTGNGGPASSARLIQPQYTAVDSAGNIYVSDSYYNQVFLIGLDGTISIFAGTGLGGYSGDGGKATAANLYMPLGLAFDAAGNLYIAESFNWRVRKVTPAGVISTFAGNGASGFGGNGGPATKAALQNPEALVFDAAGNLYISQPYNNVIRMVDTSGNITLFAGTGATGYSGDGGPANAALLSYPTGLAVDPNGALYFGDQNTVVRRIGPDGTINTFAGGINTGFIPGNGDGGPAIYASLVFPGGLAVTPDGSVYVSDSGHFVVRVITPDGTINTVAGGGPTIQDGSALLTNLPFPYGLTLDAQGDIIIAARIGRQVRILNPGGGITTVAGIDPTAYTTNGSAATSVSLLGVYGVAADASGNVYVSDDFDNRIQMIAPGGSFATFAGDSLFGSPANGGSAYILGSPWGLSVDPNSNLLVSAGTGETVFQIAPSGISTIVAGGNLITSTGDGGPAVLASLGTPAGVVSNPMGGFFVADSLNHNIRKVDSLGIITTYGGNGTPGYSGDGGPATAAQLNVPQQIALDSTGNLYIVDGGNNCIRMIDINGIITTIAGTGVQGTAGDGGAAVSAQLYNPRGVAVDFAGNVYISETNRIRLVNLASGLISTIAGDPQGAAGFGGDGGPASQALLSNPYQLALDLSNNLYVADRGNYRVRILTPNQ